jgi:hypothetical protein
MSLATALEAEKAAARKGPPCGMSVLLARLDKADATTLVAYLADRDNVTTAVIHRALLAEGHQLGKNTIERHRRGECSCGRS